MNNRRTIQTRFRIELYPALWSEFRKVLRSKALWITSIAILFITLICGLFIFILKDPEQARSLGLIGTKAQMFGGTADWVNFFNLELAIISVAGLVIFGFIFVWIFGREFGNRTFYDLLALPTSRIAIVSAKIIIAACWAFFLILITFVFMVILGNILNLPGGSSDIILTGLKQLLVTGLLTIILCLPFAMVACVTRGYLPAIGCIFMVLILSQVFDTLGYGLYFPWCIPAIYSGAATSLTGSIAEPAGTVSYILLGITGTIGVIVTGLWWLYADQS